jgi:hypothetical protein
MGQTGHNNSYAIRIKELPAEHDFLKGKAATRPAVLNLGVFPQFH